MSKTIGILIFDGAEELDFVGPFEVFTMARQIQEGRGEAPWQVLLISESGGEVKGAKGMRVLSDVAMGHAPALDVLLVPGGQGTRREVENERLLGYIAGASKGATWITSVCTGSLLLAAAGPAKGKRVTTHWGYIGALRERNEAAEVIENARYVRDGNVVTSAGVSAGIDMALWLTGQMAGPEFARLVQKYMEYDPAPPYAALV